MVVITCFTWCLALGSFLPAFTTLGYSAISSSTSLAMLSASLAAGLLSAAPRGVAAVPLEPLPPSASTVRSEGVEESASTVGSEGEGLSTTPMAAAVRLPARGAVSGIFNPAGHNSCIPERSTAILKLARKSAPMMGKATSAWRNFQLKRLPPAVICTWRRPQALMEAPEAAVRAGPVVGAVLEKGRME